MAEGKPESLLDIEQAAREAAEHARGAAEVARADRIKRDETPMEKDRRVNVENAQHRRRSRRAMATASRRKNR